MIYQVAAESRTKYQSNALGAGRLVRRPPAYWPDGVSHAVLPGTVATLCGGPVDRLWRFAGVDVDFTHPSLTMCSACVDRTG